MKRQKFNVRFPLDIHRVLKRLARKQRRSLHNLILCILEDYVRDEGDMMTNKRFRVIDRITEEAYEIEAPSAQDACERLGQMKPSRQCESRQAPGRQWTNDERTTL